MNEAQRHPAIANELALLLALATLWGASYTFLKIAVATMPLRYARTELPVSLIPFAANARTMPSGTRHFQTGHARCGAQERVKNQVRRSAARSYFPHNTGLTPGANSTSPLRG